MVKSVSKESGSKRVFALSIISDFLRNGSYKSKVTKGGIWIIFGDGLQKLLVLVKNLILVRILAAEVFGVLAIIVSFNMLFESFVEMGIMQAIIQNPNSEKKKYLNGAWLLAAVRGIGLYVIAFFAAVLVADFYKKPDLIPLMRIAFLSMVFNGLISPKIYISMKKMNFKHWSLTLNAGAIISLITAVGLSIYLKNIWALVIAFVVEYLVRMVMSFILCPFKPGFALSKEYWNELIRYVRGMLGIPLLTFIYLRTDIFVIGKMFSDYKLGLYSMGATLALMPCNFISAFITKLFMPLLSDFQNDIEKTKKIVLHSMLVILVVAFPVLMFLICNSYGVLYLTYGKEYTAVAVPFVIIFYSEMIRVSTIPIATAFFAKGRPELHRMFNIIRVVIITSSIYFFLKFFGLTGGALAPNLAMSIGLVYQLFNFKKISGCKIREILLIYVKTFTISLIVLGIGCLCSFFTSSILINITVGIVACIISYIVAFFIFPEIKEMTKLKL